MDEKSLFTQFWTNESKTTRKVFARIPEGPDIAHHRGQITTYLRPMGGRVRQICGLSGDEP